MLGKHEDMPPSRRLDGLCDTSESSSSNLLLLGQTRQGWCRSASSMTGLHLLVWSQFPNCRGLRGLQGRLELESQVALRAADCWRCGSLEGSSLHEDERRSHRGSRQDGHLLLILHVEGQKVEGEEGAFLWLRCGEAGGARRSRPGWSTRVWGKIRRFYRLCPDRPGASTGAHVTTPA